MATAEVQAVLNRNITYDKDGNLNTADKFPEIVTLESVEVITPVNANDIATKNYVDTAVAAVNEADEITVDASGFDGNLTTSDNTVQKVAQKVDDMVVDAVGASSGDYPEYLNTKLRAGTGITTTLELPTSITLVDEAYADYAAFVVGESITAGDRFALGGDADTTDNYFAFSKGGGRPLVAGDIFEDSALSSATYLGNLFTDGNFAKVKLSSSGVTMTKLMNQVLSTGNWTTGATYKEYEFSNANITANSDVEIVVTNASSAVAETANLMMENTPGSGIVTLYAVNTPGSDLTVHIRILN